MLSKYDFINMSLDLNVFFLRIMKEHCFFLEMAFTPKDYLMVAEVERLKMCFENLLCEATDLACGNVSYQAVESKQFVTQYTADAERLTNFYTGVPFNLSLTRRESMLSPGNACVPSLERAVDCLNRKAYRATAVLGEFKEKLLCNVLSCKKFTLNYPLLIEHILREARFFMRMLDDLNERRSIMDPRDLIDQEQFWNRQMAEHAKFIVGLLDPTEETLINTASMFGKEFDELTMESKQVNQQTFDSNGTTAETIEAMKRFRNFKTAGTEGLLKCNIKSIIIPLLADHVLREANHYLFVLGAFNTYCAQ